MGSIVSANCECGLSIDAMRLGHGMAYREISIFPYYCKDCKTFFLEDSYSNDIKCSSCDSYNVVGYNNPEVAKKLEPTAFNWYNQKNNTSLKLGREGSLCPRCNKFLLQFETIGSWD